VIETCAKKRVEKTNLAHWIGGWKRESSVTNHIEVHTATGSRASDCGLCVSPLTATVLTSRPRHLGSWHTPVVQRWTSCSRILEPHLWLLHVNLVAAVREVSLGTFLRSPSWNIHCPIAAVCRASQPPQPLPCLHHLVTLPYYLLAACRHRPNC
jgi:hypothetical protein